MCFIKCRLNIHVVSTKHISNFLRFQGHFEDKFIADVQLPTPRDNQVIIQLIDQSEPTFWKIVQYKINIKRPIISINLQLNDSQHPHQRDVFCLESTDTLEDNQYISINLWGQQPQSLILLYPLLRLVGQHFVLESNWPYPDPIVTFARF